MKATGKDGFLRACGVMKCPVCGEVKVANSDQFPGLLKRDRVGTLVGKNIKGSCRDCSRKRL